MRIEHPPITERAFECVEEYLEWRLQGLLEGHEDWRASKFLFENLPQGAILAAEPVETRLGVGAAVTVRKRRPRAAPSPTETAESFLAPATPRVLNTEFFAAMRLLLAPGDSAYLDTDTRAAAPAEDHNFYGKIISRCGVTWLRLISDAQPGQVANEPPVHTFLFRQLVSIDTVKARQAEGKKSRGSYQGRSTVIDAACENLAKAQSKGTMSFDLSEERLRRRLAQAFALLDQHELGSAL